MSDAPVRYAPMTRRHRLVFAIAAMVAVLATLAIAMARLALIRWWIASCPQAPSGCTLAEQVFEWWWVPWIALMAAIAFAAHWITRDRLRPLPDAP